MTGLPPLPPITDQDSLLAVFSHEVLSPVAGDPAHPKHPRRLEYLGSRTFEQALAFHYFMKDPTMSVDDIEVQIQTSPPQFVDLLHAYGCRSRIICPPELRIIYDTELEAGKFFYRYIGASFLENGAAAIQEWVSQTVDYGIPTPRLPTGRSYPHPPSSLPPVQPPPPSYSSGSTSAQQTSPTSDIKLKILAQFNLVAQQKHYTVTYPARQEGPPHNPIWYVQCCLNGDVRGEGVGQNQKQAKELAAREAWTAMGWGTLV
ncbi:hypothetical protein P691DRAFT_773882 [Macrolepiota fuliginosa MF-IS2]|uniref:DRBM domain-containing protein n=1 Tax=Macrolepiota fuliginosa MF-IS2 TaxID=1400762 RepID=A0A9P6C640_9AGAR|nr:hypothetical protein P691DRAFT_773882 [Macrolepiota fuliginosa MF-IS2]